MGYVKGYSHTQLMEEAILSKSYFKKKEQSLESTLLAPFSVKPYRRSLSLSLSQHLDENLCLTTSSVAAYIPGYMNYWKNPF